MSDSAQDYLNMSDEDFLEKSESILDEEETSVEDPEPEQQQDPTPEESASDEPEEEASANEDSGDEEESEEEDSDGGATAEETSDEESDEEAESEADGEADSEGEDDQTSDPDKDQKETNEEPNYKEFVEQITAPFKANGKDFQVDNAADAIQLMQMGVNYNKKMAALKPSLRSLRLLEDNGLLSEEKLNYLIDLDKKDPKAIAKLLQDSKLDPMDIDVEQGSEYQAPTRQVDEGAMALDEVLGNLKDSETYVQLLDTVSNKWDSNSKEIIGNHPELLNVINDHMGNGIYEIIQNKMDRERTLGRLQGLSDLEAYRQVGDAIQAEGGFDHLFQNQSAADQDQGQQNTGQKKVIPKADSQKDTARKAKKKAAGSTKTSVNSGKSADFNPLKMSDEEFLKSFNEQLL